MKKRNPYFDQNDVKVNSIILLVLNMFVSVDSVVFIVFSEFIMS